MKIKDKNELKGMSEVIVSIPDELVEKYKNRQTLALNNTFLQLFNIPINKENRIFIEPEIKGRALSFLKPRINEFVKEELIVDENGFDFVSSYVEPVNPNTNDVKVIIYTTPTVSYNYKDLEKPEPFQGLTDEEKEQLINVELKELQKKNARLTPLDRPYEEGDVVSIIQAGPNESFENRQSEILFPEDLEKNPTLKENLIGKSVDDTFSYEPFNNTTTKVVQIYESDMDEIDDDFASEVSEFDTLDELKDFIVETEENKLKDQYLEEQKNNLLLQFLDSIKIEDVEDKLINFVNNYEGVNKNEVSMFMDGFYNNEQQGEPLTEYYQKILQYIYDLILQEENVNTDEIIKDTIENWDSGELNEKYKDSFTILKNYQRNLSKEILNESIADVINSNSVKDIIFKYSLDSEN